MRERQACVMHGIAGNLNESEPEPGMSHTSRTRWRRGRPVGARMLGWPSSGTQANAWDPAGCH